MKNRDSAKNKRKVRRTKMLWLKGVEKRKRRRRRSEKCRRMQKNQKKP